MGRPKKQVQTNAPKANNAPKERITLSNPSATTPFGINTRKGLILLSPLEVRVVPQEIENDIRILFKNKTFQKSVECGRLRVSGFDNEKDDNVDTKTPDAPASLTSAVNVGEEGTSAEVTTPLVVTEVATVSENEDL